MNKNIRSGSSGDAFVMVPEWVLLLPISATALRVYCVVRRHADAKTGECFPTRRTIATKARCSVASVDRSVKELVTNGAVTAERRKNKAGDWTSNLYTILPTPFAQVASKEVVPTPTDDGTGHLNNDARTITNLNKKQSSAKYDIQRRQDLSLALYFYNIGASLKAVQDTALGRTLVVDEFLRLSQKQTSTIRRAK